MTGRWGVLAILCLARLSLGLHLQAVAAVAPFMMADLGLGYGEIGTLIGAFLLPGVALAVPGGLVSRRFGDKSTLLGALLLLVVGTAMLAVSSGFWPALLARLMAGAGGTLLAMQVAKIATDWFAGRELSTAMGVLLGTFPLGIAAVMVGLPIVAEATSWRLAVALVAVAAMAIFAIVAVWLRDAPRSLTDGQGTASPRRGISRREAGLALIAGGAFSLINASYVIFTSFAPVVLRQGGMGAVEAGVLVSWASWALIATPPLVGYVLDRWGGLTAWLLGSATIGALACVALPGLHPTWLWIILFGMVMGPTAVGSMALPGEVLRPETRAVGFGLFFTTNYVAFSILPAVGGLLIDLTDSPATTMAFNAVILLAFMLLVLWFRRVQRPIISAELTDDGPSTDRPSKHRKD